MATFTVRVSRVGRRKTSATAKQTFIMEYVVGILVDVSSSIDCFLLMYYRRICCLLGDLENVASSQIIVFKLSVRIKIVSRFSVAFLLVPVRHGTSSGNH